MIPGLCLFDSFKKALLCYIQKFLCFRTDLTNRMCPGRVRMISFVDQSCIQAHNVAFFQDAVSLRDTVNNLFVHRYTDGCWKTTVMQEIRLAAKFPDHFIALLIDLHGGDTRTNDLCHLIMYNFQPSASLTHQFDLFCRFYCNSHNPYAPKISTIALNTSPMSMVPSTSFRIPFLV